MREPTAEERQQSREREYRNFGITTNYCQSIPPQHTPHRIGERIYCTTCGEEITEAESTEASPH